eukprot:Rhum_TRINITY_DN20782_c0_g2::Rhum_TRINITY_DN20782_c0_g2_i1::g.172105::m.172105
MCAQIAVFRGANMCGLRKAAVALAQTHVGYDGTFAYDLEDGAVKPGGALTVTVYFHCHYYYHAVDNAGKFVNGMLAELESRGVDLNTCTIRTTEVVHTVKNRIYSHMHYPSPDRGEWDDVSSSSRRPVVDVARLSMESLSPLPSAATYEDCHIIENSRCVGDLGRLADDKTNRVILEPVLHQLYDGRGKSGVPEIALHCSEEEMARLRTHHSETAPSNAVHEVRVDIECLFVATISEVTWRVKAGSQVGNVFSVVIHHHDPWRFALLLQARYAENKAWASGASSTDPARGPAARDEVRKQHRPLLVALCHPHWCPGCFKYQTTREIEFDVTSLTNHQRQCTEYKNLSQSQTT